jgi:hypothetical protein
MGRVKNALIAEHEQKMLDLDRQYSFDFGEREILRRVQPATREQWVSYGMANQQDWAEYEKEFNAWLDAYEASFGDQS